MNKAATHFGNPRPFRAMKPHGLSPKLLTFKPETLKLRSRWDFSSQTLLENRSYSVRVSPLFANVSLSDATNYWNRS